MGTSPDYPPYEFFADAAMTEYAGIDVEVAKYIAESMGMTLQIESMNFDNLVTSLSNGDFDVVLAACEYTEERAKACDFSDPYYTDVPPAILVKADKADQYKTLADFNGKSIGAVESYTCSSLKIYDRITVEFTDGTLPFTDVRETDWFYDDVVFAYENHLV